MPDDPLESDIIERLLNGRPPVRTTLTRGRWRRRCSVGQWLSAMQRRLGRRHSFRRPHLGGRFGLEMCGSQRV